MEEKDILGFKMECSAYLYTVSIHSLRCYGRSLLLRTPSAMKKGDLISMILRVLVGETKQTRASQGAPSKTDFVEPIILQTINALKEKYGLSTKETGDENAQAQAPVLQENDTTLDENEQNAPVFATFEVNFSALSAKQKKLLASFLNSL